MTSLIERARMDHAGTVTKDDPRYEMTLTRISISERQLSSARELLAQHPKSKKYAGMVADFERILAKQRSWLA